MMQIFLKLHKKKIIEVLYYKQQFINPIDCRQILDLVSNIIINNISTAFSKFKQKIAAETIVLRLSCLLVQYITREEYCCELFNDKMCSDAKFPIKSLKSFTNG